MYVFFVLSGFVLVRPFVGDGTATWSSYYRTRLLRLYLPVWGALLFAVALWAAFGRSTTTGSSWVDGHAAPPTLASVLGDLTLVAPSFLDSSLWSLKWEVAFSLLLPVYVATATACRKWGAWTLILPPVLVMAGMLVRSPAMTYMPMFLMGSLLALRLRSPNSPSTPMPPRWSVTLGVMSVALLTTSWWSPVRGAAGTALAVVGAALVLVLFLKSPGVVRVAEHKIAQTLGRWSFSLYLVHAPLVITLVGAVVLPPATLAPLVLALSLSCAALFHRLVELPALAFARRQGSRTPRKMDGAQSNQVMHPGTGAHGASLNVD